METDKNLLVELITNTERGQHRPFQLLINYREYFRARKIRRAHKLLVASLKQSLDKQLKKYCKAITAGETEVIKLFAYCTINKVLEFYEEELRIINDMIDEYECYLEGNLLDFILGLPRPANKLYDHRGK